jgi:hypothetical protein
MIKIDFHGSTHGHFLEYVANVYIMQTTPSQVSIFKPPTYSAHSPDKYYLKSRIIECGHFSAPRFKSSIEPLDTIIRIKLDAFNDNMFFVVLTNLIYKAGDVGFENQMLSIPESIRNDPVSLRNNWYSKFNERELYASHYTNFPSLDNEVFEFTFESFFSFKNFCTELSRLAKFLNQTFYPNQSLYDLWSEFIQVNQGWQSYVKCNHLLDCMLSNVATKVDCTAIEQGWINYNLSKICCMFDGPMFDQVDYPSNTCMIYNTIQNHFVNLR